ncbi:MAG: hypothetical protein P8Q41_08335 [Saprospiraceae bacterium]|nr:hypothetical protein [Saprospiraceae bacterium]
MSKRVLGKVIYHDFSGGFWGIVSDKGIEYRPLNFPIQLKKEGVRVDIVVEDMNDEISMFMWGQPVKIISFSIL